MRSFTFSSIESTHGPLWPMGKSHKNERVQYSYSNKQLFNNFISNKELHIHFLNLF